MIERRQGIFDEYRWIISRLQWLLDGIVVVVLLFLTCWFFGEPFRLRFQALGLATFPRRNQPLFLNRDQASWAEPEYSEATAAQLDEEIKELLRESETRVKELLTGRRELLEKISRKLLETEVIEAEEFKQLLAA